MTTMAEPLSTGRSPAASLQERVLLVAPTMGYWKGHYKLRGAKITIGGEEIDKKKTTTPQTKLMESSEYTKAWEKKFLELDNERNTIVGSFSRTFPITGVRIIPRTAAAAFFDALIGKTDDEGRPVYDSTKSGKQSLAFRLQEEANSFVENYDRVITEIRRNQPAEIWNYVNKHIPPKGEMRDKFYLDVMPIELQGSGAEQVTRGDLEQYDHLVRQSTMRMVDDAVAEMIAGPRNELAKALEDLHDLISRDGRVRDSSFNGVRNAISQIRLFSFVANDELLAKIRELDQRIGNIDATAIDSVTAANNGLLTALTAMKQEVTDEVKRAEDVEKFGKELRGFSF